MAKSLLDGIDVDSGKSKKSSSSGGGDGSTMKLVLAVGLLVVALGILGWYYLLRDTAPKVPPPDPQEIQALEQHQKQVEEAARKGGHTVGGS